MCITIQMSDEWNGYCVVQSCALKWTHVFSLIRLPAAEGADCTLGGSKDKTWGRRRQLASQSSHRLWPLFPRLHHGTKTHLQNPQHGVLLVLEWTQCNLLVFLISPGDTLRGSWYLALDAPFFAVGYVTKALITYLFSQCKRIRESVSGFISHCLIFLYIVIFSPITLLITR